MSKELIIQGNSWVAMQEQAKILVKSGFLPESIKTPEQAMAIAIKGHEVGMPMMQAFAHIHIIKGKPAISAEGMNGLIRKHCPNGKVEIIVLTEALCTIRATRPNERAIEFNFSMDDAKRAGLTSNATWQKYPKDMLFNRCMSQMARKVFPDCIAGISYTPEELGADIVDGEIVVPKEENKQLESKEKDISEHSDEEVYTGTTWQKNFLMAILRNNEVNNVAAMKAAHELAIENKITIKELDAMVRELKEINYE